MAIKYRYKTGKAISLKDIKCPICNGEINWTNVIEHTSWNGNVKLLAECWSGYIDLNHVNKKTKKHLFIINIKEDDLPRVDIYKSGKSRKGK